MMDMKTDISTFCKKYALKRKNDKDILENEMDFRDDYRARIKFHVNVIEHIPNTFKDFSYSGENLFELDADDLKYLFDKYSKRLQEEMIANIEEIKKMYE